MPQWNQVPQLKNIKAIALQARSGGAFVAPTKENMTKLFLKTAKKKIGLGNLAADAFSAWRSL